MSKQFVRLIQHRGRRRRRRDTGDLAAQLAPLEEQDIRAAQQQGAKESGPTEDAKKLDGRIVIDTDSLVLPKAIGDGETKRFLGIERVVLVIVGLMLAFIAFIAWQISQMPAQ
jgi:hypothetical protein